MKFLNLSTQKTTDGCGRVHLTWVEIIDASDDGWFFDAHVIKFEATKVDIAATPRKSILSFARFFCGAHVILGKWFLFQKRALNSLMGLDKIAEFSQLRAQIPNCVRSCWLNWSDSWFISNLVTRTCSFTSSSSWFVVTISNYSDFLRMVFRSRLLWLVKTPDITMTRYLYLMHRKNANVSCCDATSANKETSDVCPQPVQFAIGLVFGPRSSRNSSSSHSGLIQRSCRVSTIQNDWYF